MAVTLLAVGSVGILLVWFGLGGDRSGHAHAAEGSSVIAGAAVGAPSVAVTTAPTASAPPEAADGHTGHTEAETGAAVAPGTTADRPSDTAPAAEEPEDPDAPAADRRQISLAEAAGDGVPTSTAAVPVAADKWLDPEAAGVNEGTKQQAADVALQPAPVVDPSDVLPNGLVNGCVAGYGRGVQCLPKTPPSHAGHGSGQDMSIYWTCAEARTVLPDGIVVDNPGADPLGLDSNRDGLACGAGDR